MHAYKSEKTNTDIYNTIISIQIISLKEKTLGFNVYMSYLLMIHLAHTAVTEIFTAFWIVSRCLKMGLLGYTSFRLEYLSTADFRLYMYYK